MPGDARLDQDILAQIFMRVRDLYQSEGGKFPDPILNVRWPYTKPLNPSLSEVAREINGQAIGEVTDPVTGQVVKAGQQLPGFAFLRDDGTTLCGNWIYAAPGPRPAIRWRGAAPKIHRGSGFTRTGHGRGRPIAVLQPRVVRSVG